MKVVFLTRAPSWYSFRGDHLETRLTEAGHQIVGFVVERQFMFDAICELVPKIGVRVFVKKSFQKGLRLVTSILQLSSHKAISKGLVAAPCTKAKVYFVDSHNSPTCEKILRSLDPDVIVLRGCGIIKQITLNVPRIGTLNAHYGLLPKYRGVYVTEWAVLHGDPVGVSLHFVNAGVDTGPLLSTRVVPVQVGDTLASLREKSAAVAADLIVETINGLASGTITPIPQDSRGGRQYFKMHPRLRMLAEKRLTVLHGGNVRIGRA